MAHQSGIHGFYVALFDVLGFEALLNRIGLEELHKRYGQLIARIEDRESHMARMFGEWGLGEAPYWCNDKSIFLFYKVKGAFASDSLLLWANRTWPQARGKTDEELRALESSDAKGWEAAPVPPDNFLDECNELICHGLEVELPLRGAVSLGEAILDDKRRVFLGVPLVEVARLEKAQNIIGAGVCKAFSSQLVPERYEIEFGGHLKPNASEFVGGKVLDWPRHWSSTRSQDIRELVESLNTSPDHLDYYSNTQRLIRESGLRGTSLDMPDKADLRRVYPQFSYQKDIAVRARRVRRVASKI